MKGYSKRGKKLPYWGKTQRLLRIAGKRTVRSARSHGQTYYRIASERKHIKAIAAWRRTRFIKYMFWLTIMAIALIIYLITLIT